MVVVIVILIKKTDVMSIITLSKVSIFSIGKKLYESILIVAKL